MKICWTGCETILALKMFFECGPMNPTLNISLKDMNAIVLTAMASTIAAFLALILAANRFMDEISGARGNP